MELPPQTDRSTRFWFFQTAVAGEEIGRSCWVSSMIGEYGRTRTDIAPQWTRSQPIKQTAGNVETGSFCSPCHGLRNAYEAVERRVQRTFMFITVLMLITGLAEYCLLYTSDAADE